MKCPSDLPRFDEPSSFSPPKVSVLMPTYNNGEFLAEAIESIGEQSFRDFEFIIVDDGSEDNTREILGAYAARDPRIRVLRNEENRGIVHSLNRGLGVCRGEYIARMDSDDIALRDRLEKQIAFLEKNPRAVALGAALSYIDREGRDLGVIRHCPVNRSLIGQNPLLHPTVVFRREVITRHGFLFQERYRYAEDYFLWLQMSRVGRIGAIDDTVLRYRISGSAIRMRHVKEVIRATLKVKAAGVLKLGITPRFGDLLRLAAEGLLLLLPASGIRLLYLRTTFGGNRRVSI